MGHFSSKRGSVLAIVILGGVLPGILPGCKRVVDTSHSYSALTASALSHLASYVLFHGMLAGGLPPDTESLERWLQTEWNDQYKRMELEASHVNARAPVMTITDEGQVRLVDVWGHRIVYRYPSDNPAYAFRFYSVGPNGVDENGSGDDIDRSPAKAEEERVRKGLDELRRDRNE